MIFEETLKKNFKKPKSSEFFWSDLVLPEIFEMETVDHFLLMAGSVQ